MKRPQAYVLVLDQDSDNVYPIEPLLHRLHGLQCPVEVARSAEQAIAKVSQDPPLLIILAGNQQNWSETLVNQLRITANDSGITIVALTDFHAPSWLRQEENPGLDGFLVKPLNRDVLVSLVQSAWARQTYCSAN